MISSFTTHLDARKSEIELSSTHLDAKDSEMKTKEIEINILKKRVDALETNKLERIIEQRRNDIHLKLLVENNLRHK